MGSKMERRRFAVVCACVATGAGVLALHTVLFTSVPPEPGEYFLTELARAQLGPVSVTLALVLAAGFGASQIPPVVVGLSMVATFPLIALYEASVFRGSHNLLPFEMAIVALWSIPLIFAAYGGRWTARRYERHDLWAFDDPAP